MNALSGDLRQHAEAAVIVRAPGRLHLGFLDPSGSLGRRFGSLGLVIDGFETVLELRAARADTLLADEPGEQAELPRLAEGLKRLRDQTGLTQALELRLHRALPVHAGFGSGTQLALALGRAFAALHGLEIDTPTLARWLGRGLRSGIGIAGFDRGGLLVDGGPSPDGAPAPMLARLDLPAAWRVIVALDPSRQGLSGADERRAIGILPPLPRERAADLCHQVLMRLLPGAAQGDFAAFAAGLNVVQQVLGEHFAPAQQGSAWTSRAVERLMQALSDAAGGAVAIGQSSWGPTGFAIVESAARADALLRAAREAGAIAPELQLRVVGARNHGASVATSR